ncbi:MAG: hypothetical protein ACRBFS_09005 [Aureispira sp.]
MLEAKWTSFLKWSVGAAILFLLVGQATAQCESWESYPAGAQPAKEKHVMYRDLVKSKKYEEAFPIWKELFATVKIPLPAKTTHYRDGITMYKEFAKAEKDKTKKEEFLNQMMALYDEMAECLGEQSKDRAYEGYYIYSARGSSEKAIEFFERSLELGKNETHNMVMVPLTQLTVYLFQKKHPKFTAEYMRNLHKQLEELKDHNIKNNEKTGPTYEKKWVKVQAEFQKIESQVFGCDYYTEKLILEFEKDKTNMEQNKEILDMIKKKCGTENEFYSVVNAVYKPWKDSVDLADKEARFKELCNLEKGKFRELQSRRAEKKGETEKVVEYKKEAFEWYKKSLNDPSSEGCETTEEEKGDLAYRIAYREYRNGSYGSARTYANKAAKLKSGWGEPYLLIGNMYASSGKRCSGGAGTGWDAQVVTWAAMDMWAKAKSVDSRVASKANSQIAKYKKYLPTKGDIFQRGYKEGQSYKVGCWIGATTTIRSSGE